jgi:hypothetical protein
MAHTLAATHSMIDNCGVAENIGFLHHYLDLGTVMGQDVGRVQLEHVNLAGMYILNWVCTSQSMSMVGA